MMLVSIDVKCDGRRVWCRAGVCACIRLISLQVFSWSSQPLGHLQPSVGAAGASGGWVAECGIELEVRDEHLSVMSIAVRCDGCGTKHEEPHDPCNMNSAWGYAPCNGCCKNGNMNKR
eukprot:611368-Pelagomonas_calceolata.AAC.3